MSTPANLATVDQLKQIELATVAQRMLPQGCNALGNLNRLPFARLAGLNPHMLEGLPVLLCGAGPSLDKDDDALRELARRSVVVSVSTAAPALLSKGIRIDAIACMESMDTSRPIRELGRRFETAWLDIAAHPNSWKACEGRPIVAWHGPSPEVWLVTWGLQAPPILHGGSVTTAAAATALLMGCRDLTLIGCNFAMEAGRIYAEHGAWGDERMELEEVDDAGQQWASYRNRCDHKDEVVEEGSGVRVPDKRTVKALKGWEDETLYATMDYVTQLIWFSKLRKHYPSARFVNCSVGGAKIDGFQHQPLADRLARTERPVTLPPGEAYKLRLEGSRPVGERAAMAKAYAESAADSTKKIAEAVLAGRPTQGLPWLHDVGVVKPFTVEREIHLMMAQKQGQQIPHVDSVAVRRTDAVHGAGLVLEAMKPEDEITVDGEPVRWVPVAEGGSGEVLGPSAKVTGVDHEAGVVTLGAADDSEGESSMDGEQ